MVLLFGCNHRNVDQTDPFRLIYDFKPVRADSKLKKSVKSDFSLSVKEMPILELARIISDSYSVGVVVADSLKNSVVTLDLKNSDLQSFFTILSRQLSSDVVFIGNTFFIGDLRDEDRGILIRRVISHDLSTLEKTVKTILSSSGKSAVLNGGIVVISDKDFVITRAIEVLDSLESISVDSWIVQLYFVVLRRDSLAEAGLSMTSSGSLSYNISKNSFEVENFKLDAIFNGLIESNLADLYASPMFILRDGVSGKWHDGQRIPVPKRTVSDSGTVTTSGFEYVQTGLEVNCTVNETRAGGLLDLSLSLSDIQSYVESAPVTSSTSCNISLDMLPNKIYLLGELDRFSVLSSQSKTLSFSRDRGRSLIQVWGRIYKVSAPSKLLPPVSDID